MNPDKPTTGDKEDKKPVMPTVSLPKGGGAIRGIGEKFTANPVMGTGAMTVPIAVSPGRSGFGPELSLSYNSGNGNGAFGFGWSLSVPCISRKTDKGLPRYFDVKESDEFILSGAEDLVPVLKNDGTRWTKTRIIDGIEYILHRYYPRIEGLFARIERWTRVTSGETHWRSISSDNITTVYGLTSDSRIFDPADPTRIFTWLICESYDSKGNAIVYEFAPENADNVDLLQANERNRIRAANRYLKHIRYGNRKSRLVEPDLSKTGWLFDIVFDYDENLYTELPLDPNKTKAEQHQYVAASASGGLPWPVRPDPFSAYRSGFEVRTYRRCRRVMMFHHFDELGIDPVLVRSTGFDYRDFDYSQPFTIKDELSFAGSTRFASFICRITQSGYTRQQNGTYLKKSMPSIEFEYSKAIIQEDIRELDTESIENLPIGLDGFSYQWVDLDGEGVTGILTKQAAACFYKSNLGDGKFGPMRQVGKNPSLAALGGQKLLDLSGAGRLDLVALSGPAPGYYERTADEDWEVFEPFKALPNIPWDDPNTRFVDLDGDGLADVLITEHEVMTWYPSLAADGFGPGTSVRQSQDEEKGPKLIFADSAQSIYLADMTGDGLTDLVRIRNHDICYWPNIGYGRFGAKVAMDNAPWMDSAEEFNQQRVRLSDINGSGTCDIIYLGRDCVRLYFNQEGNRLSNPYSLFQLSQVDNFASIMTADLLGNGTSCLVWSSPMPANARTPLRYIDLMGGNKPYLLIKSINNLGAETVVRYESSTHFYLQDKAAGKPWITKLPFPVHVIERVDTYDRISRNRFVARYAYHHGYFDGVEREFRGFGMVEQWDTEEFSSMNETNDFPAAVNIDAASHIPPVYTKTWFHTGIYLGREHVSDFFAGLNDTGTGEYYREPGLTDSQARQILLDDTVLPSGLTFNEEREACRSLKGSMLRREVYGLDKTIKAGHPYFVTEQNFGIELIQKLKVNRHAVFFTHSLEVINYHYERNPEDPRITHALTLSVDMFGNVLKSAEVAYGRRKPDSSLPVADRTAQSRIYITYTETDVTNPIDLLDDDYHTPLPYETRTYELTGLSLLSGEPRFSIEKMIGAGISAAILDYQNFPTQGLLEKRLIEHIRTLYSRDDLSGLLSPGVLEPLAIPFESYKLSLTPGIITGAFGTRVNSSMMETDGCYVHSQGDTDWWIPSGRIFYSPLSTDTPAQESAYARKHFYKPHRFRNPFHTSIVSTESFVSYDSYDLLVVEARDALGNIVTAKTADDSGSIAIRIDYRALAPSWVTDPNGNRASVAFDALGMVVCTAAMGKPLPSPTEGDSLAGCEPDLTESVILDHISNPFTAPETILAHATTRLVYDLFAYERTKAQAAPQSAVVYTLARETHSSDPVPPGGLKIRHGFSYSDGFGREIQKKIQAEPGPAPRRDINGKIVIGPDGQPNMTPTDINPRWVGNGWTVYNNKGKPVRKYEPFFTDTHFFEFEVCIGVSPVLFYDPAGRLVATLHPDHTWEKVVFDSFKQETWDKSDTLLVSDPKSDPDTGNFFIRLPDSDYLPSWYDRRKAGALGPEEQSAAQKAEFHAGTPTIAYPDSLGRTFLTLDHNKFKYSNTPQADPPIEELYGTRVVIDIEGNQREVRDAVVQNTDTQGRIVMQYDYDMLGNCIHHTGMDSGDRFMLNDVSGKPLYAWDNRNHRFHTLYDPLHRPTDSLVREGIGKELVEERTVYGETQADPETNNLRGKTARVFDQAGVVNFITYDFKGNVLRSERTLAVEYKTTLDWSVVTPLDSVVYTSRTSLDALNRPVELTMPDSSVIRQDYNEANLLEHIEANLRGASQNGEAVWTTFVENIDYDAMGRRILIEYGSGATQTQKGVTTTYAYDPFTFLLTDLLTIRNKSAFPDDCPAPPPAGWPGCQVQNLHYTYDPSGNVVHIRDDAQETIYFRNKRVDPSADYTYDALNRLIESKGREHLGQVGGVPIPHSYNDFPGFGLQHPNDGNAMGTYLERYLYDPVGNFLRMSHIGSAPANPGWTRIYDYSEPSPIESAKTNNRLSSTTVGSTTETYGTGGNGYDAHGNMLRMPQIQILQWDFKDQLQMTQRQAVNTQDADGVQHQGERTWYVYDAGGTRVRKVTESAPDQIIDERIYLNGFEIYRKHGINPLVRETLHIMDIQSHTGAESGRRIALVETRTDSIAPEQLIRYQFGNHLDSACLELDDQAHIISYEEFTPFGSTSYHSVRSQTETPKRYRFTSMERDEETGFGYHGARYYIPWLGRWTACDPQGIKPFINVYAYSFNNPINAHDKGGGEPAWVKKAYADAKKEVAKVPGAVVKTYTDAKAEAVKTAGAAKEAAYKAAGAAHAVTGMEYDPAQGIFYSIKDAPQRIAGYFDYYDKFAPNVMMYIDSEPIRFKYGGRDWKIELWKGRYGAAPGAEIGVYVGNFVKKNLDAPAAALAKKSGADALARTYGVPIPTPSSKIIVDNDTNSATDADMLQMKFTLKTRGGTPLFHREGLAWWLTGFKPFAKGTKTDLIMRVTIYLKDEPMQAEFIKALKAMGYSPVKDGTTGVSFVFDRPHAQQPDETAAAYSARVADMKAKGEWK
jgi:RHS repeat-associated protein